MRTKALFIPTTLATACLAKDIKTVVFRPTPEIVCKKCENPIKSNISFEKGVKAIITNLEQQTITITYDADKPTLKNSRGVQKDRLSGGRSKKEDSENTQK
jgi:copper chaperone CopZ